VLYFNSLTKKRKPETDVCTSGNSLFKKFTSSNFFRVEMSTRGYKKIISTAINLVESPWWPPSEQHLVLHENMKPAFLLVRVALLNVAKQDSEKRQKKTVSF